MEKEGYIEKIIYKNEGNGYTVFTVVDDNQEETTFVGVVEGAEEGVYIMASGEEVEHPTYDMQFKVESYDIRMPDDKDSMEKYLASGAIKGIGEVTAARIVNRFGLDTFRIIEEEPERLSEIKGISSSKAREIGICFREKSQMRDAMIFLGNYGISPNLCVKIFDEYGSRLYKIIETNPYKIAEDISGVGFKVADEIARQAGIGQDSDFRIRAALLYTLLKSNGLGHMYLPKQLLVRKTLELLGSDGAIASISDEVIDNQIVGLTIDGKLMVKKIDDMECVYSSTNYYLELNCARMLCELDAAYEVDEAHINKQIGFIEKKEHIVLDDTQKQAVLNAAKSGVFIITGGPGTGKTTTINAIIKYFEEENMEISLGAPTGRAAKRITEATGYKAQTIHRLLEINGGVDMDSGYQFERNASNPLETDVIIIDEVSMVDMYILHALLSATVCGTHLILVGDVNQLPSVGPGNVLRDIIESTAFNICVLNKIYRQEEGSDIVVNAHKINNGEHFVMNNKSKDFFYMPRLNSKAVIEEIGQLVKRKLPSYVDAGSLDIQVLTPMRNGELGVENLNNQLQQVLNPPSKSKKEKEIRGTIFRVGDKVMQIKNNYKLPWTIFSPKGRFKVDEGLGVFNGDMGVITEINDFDENVTVVFDDNKEVSYSYSALDELELAYAITIHKSQGSEYPAVVIPLLGGPRILLNRNLLYTAITRAKKCAVIVGNGNVVDMMIDNTEEQKRYTSLKLRINEFRSDDL